MDNPAVLETTRRSFHTDLARLNRILGNNAYLVEKVRRHAPRTVLDIGCGEGALLNELRKQLGVCVQGIDLRPCEQSRYGITVKAADATTEPLPESDLALCVLTVHHLNERQVVDLVRNVGRSCRRFVILDLVRHPLPLMLYSTFIRPLVTRLVLEDGCQSIRRAYTPEELRRLVVRGLCGTGAVFEHWVSPIYGKQVIDIDYRKTV